MRSPVSIRQSLLRSLLWIILLAGGAIILTIVMGTRRNVRKLSGEIINQSIGRMELELEQFFVPIMDQLMIARSWGERGMLDLDNIDTINELFVSIMNQHPQISSTLIADGNGRENMILREGEVWRNRHTKITEKGAEVFWLEWKDSIENATTRDEILDYDPRERPWYEGAIAKRHQLGSEGVNPIFWTRPYTFFTTKDPGITVSATFELDDGTDHVIGFDVLLYDIFEFIGNLRISDHGNAVVLTTDGKIIGMSPQGEFRTASEIRGAYLKSPSELGLSLASSAAEVLDFRRNQPGIPVRFESDDRMWWGVAKPFYLTPERRLRIAVIVPESDILGDLALMRAVIIALLITVLGVAVLRAFTLARKYSEPIEKLVEQSVRISKGDLERGETIESEVSEVRRLAKAHDHMREGLQSLMKLERDLQLARQIQQSTFPKQLPSLVNIELDAWSEPAEETGGDTYDVIGYTLDVISMDSVQRSLNENDASGKTDGVMFLLADATGHGVGPALAVTQIRAMLRMALRLGSSLGDVAVHLNEQLVADLPVDRFITAWLGELNVSDATITSFSAGQAPILHYRRAEDEFKMYMADTPPFGVLKSIDIQINQPITLHKGDIFAVISDGIFEARRRGEEFFGQDRVEAIIRENRDTPPKDITRALLDAVREYTDGAPAEDDRTGIIIKHKG